MINNENQTQNRQLITTELLGQMMLALYVGSTPYIVFDIWFACQTYSCTTNADNALNISPQLYLAAAGFINSYGLVLDIFGLLSYNNINESFYIGLLIIIKDVGGFLWTILGAIMYWGTIYPNKRCDAYLSTYLFIRLIVGLLSWLINVLSIPSFVKRHSISNSHQSSHQNPLQLV